MTYEEQGLRGFLAIVNGMMLARFRIEVVSVVNGTHTLQVDHREVVGIGGHGFGAVLDNVLG